MRSHTVYPTDGADPAGRRSADLAVSSLRQARAAGSPARPLTPRRESMVRRAALPVLCVVAVILYSVQAPVLGAAYGVGVIGMLLALPTSAAVVLSYFNSRAAVGLTLAGTIVIAAVASAYVTAESGLPYPWTVPSMLALFVCCLVMGLSVLPTQAAITWLVMITISALLELVFGGFGESFWVVFSLSALMTLVGVGIRLLVATQAKVDEQAELGAQERERREILEEKAKMARELHDVVAHHMSVITVQAASAEYRIPGMSPEVRAEFTAISEQSRSSLAELRRILGALRGDDEAMALAPQPGIADLPRVIEHVTRAGTTVQLSSVELSDLPEAVSIAAYRIIQESLSNVVRHAPQSEARVSVQRSAGAIEIVVTNEASQHPGVAVSGGGHGLRGMRERASALGGTLSAGPLYGGGFEVRAWIPVLPTDEPAYADVAG